MLPPPVVDPTQWEAAHDKLIVPLMDQIITVCQAFGIPTSCVFQLTSGEDPTYCATQIPAHGSPILRQWVAAWQRTMNRVQEQSEWRTNLAGGDE